MAGYKRDEQSKRILPEAPPKPLTEEMRALIDAKRASELDIQVEAEILAKQKFEAEQAYLEEARKKAVRKAQPEKALRPIIIDLPDEAPYILLDGRSCYYPDVEYQVDADIHATLSEIMARAWFNEECRLDESKGNLFRRTRNVQLGGKRNVRQYSGA